MTGSLFKPRNFLIAGVLVAAAGIAVSLHREGYRHTAPAASKQAAMARLVRISPSQYRQTIVDLFGPTVVVDTQLTDAEKRSGGLLAVGNSEVSVTSSGFESAEAISQEIASQIVNPQHRDNLIPCKPASLKGPDDACARKFFGPIGRLLFRRNLEDTEVAEKVALAREAAEARHDFYSGIELGLQRMLVSPHFLFRVERAVADPTHAGKFVLTGYSRAARLSALLWNSAPDEELLQAAEKGDLDSAAGMTREVNRMLVSPKLENGVRAFFSDMLEFDKFESLGKDPSIYPQFTPNLPGEMQEQALRVIVHELLSKRGDYRDLFLTRETFLTPSLAALSDVVLSDGVNNGEPDRWVPYTYEPNDPRGGFLALPAFTALNSHPGKSSPTLRGKALRQDLLCQVVPDPPANVDFQLFNSGTAGATARDRLLAHSTSPACAGCHRIMDPIGLGLEHFDGSGHLRETENGHAIDTSGQLDGVKYTDSLGLAKAASESSSVASCLVDRVYAYGTARPLTAADRAATSALRKKFIENGRRLPDLLRAIATDDQFYQIDPPRDQAKRVLVSQVAGARP